jgi:hypothetical protein
MVAALHHVAGCFHGCLDRINAARRRYNGNAMYNVYFFAFISTPQQPAFTPQRPTWLSHRLVYGRRIAITACDACACIWFFQPLYQFCMPYLRTRIRGKFFGLLPSFRTGFSVA